MKKMLQRTRSVLNGNSRRVHAVWMAVLFLLVSSAAAFAQQTTVSGTVTSTTGAPLPGVTVRVQGTDNRVVTDANGKYRITAPADAVLTFSLVGQKPIIQPVSGRGTVDVSMSQIPYLEQVVVTAYTEQRRGDITGAVASADVDAAKKQSSASIVKALDATVPGVTVQTSGSPGSRSTVRIRGISSFQNNDPLYVVDGTPVQDSYVNFLNPEDIASIQVLKDASAASIYGSRASNGVILIETIKGNNSGAPTATLRARTGIATPTKGYDDILLTNSLDYFAVQRQRYLNAGVPIPDALTRIYGDPNNPSVPAYTFVTPGAVLTKDAFGRPLTVDASKYSYPNALIIPGSAGTNWWKEVFGSAPVQDYNLDVRGGGAANAYAVSFNYFDQKGTAKYTDFKRGNVRVNTSFNRSKLNFGENIALSVDRHFGGIPDDPSTQAENGILGKDILQQPVVPVYDIAGNFGGAKGVPADNSSNPLKNAFDQKDNISKDNQVFGNIFGGLNLTPTFSLLSRLGFDVRQNSFAGYSAPTPQNREASFSNGINEYNYQQLDWTWSNTARYVKTISRSSFDFLLGQEANAGNSRFLSGSISNLLNTNISSRYIQDALADPSTKNVGSSGGQHALLSLFGKAGFNFADKYIASLTLRRDGSSNLAPGHQWGTFPAVGLGWRITNEPFFANNRIFSDVMLRYGWGVTGNQEIPSGRIVSTFGGDRGDTFYDISGSNTSIVPGFRQQALGNPNLKWEENRSTNVGADVSLFEGALNVVLDVYRRNTDNLLFDPRTPATAGVAAPPIVNIGKMRNTGFDFSVGHTGSWWNATFNGSHYKNTILSIDGVQTFFFGPGATRIALDGSQTINMIGHPIGSFYGYIADGYFQNAADVAAHATQDGAAPGRIKFRDVNGDGKITAEDRTIIGSPHPNFTAGLDLGAHRGSWDASATIFGTYGNKIFENQMDFYVFQDFSSNVRKDLLANSWTPQNPNAKYPILDINDTYSDRPSSYFVKDGSYTRLRNLQVGYTLPGTSRYLPGARVYVQGENLFTKTNYDGLDPALPPVNASGAAGDIRDQFMGVDQGAYPTNRIFSIGITTSF
ncbi:MAG TPA: SusC/RagA family TonB-linked outer membrane protein [Gemmatimonadaceae bacterium]|nr:SusC/RagA family TonB-linked outer membrane protein [Gemmatimonadaceae bacterium]